MTWHNLPCAPTLPALFAACPNGWAELVLASHPGNHRCVFDTGLHADDCDANTPRGG